MDVTKYLIEHVEKGKKDLKGIDHSIAEFASMNNLPIGEMYHIMSIYFAANLILLWLPIALINGIRSKTSTTLMQGIRRFSSGEFTGMHRIG